MADDVQDIYIATEAGDAGWQSLTELTASKVDAKLPIESVDGTVVLSDSSGSFEVSTGGEERVTVNDSATTVHGESTVPFELFSTAPGSSCSMVFNRNGNANRWTIGADTFGLAVYRGAGIGDKAFGIDENKVATFPGSVKTPSVSGLADNDASVTLGSTFDIYVNYDNATNMTSAFTIRNSNTTEPNSPPLEFFGNRLDGSSAARLGKMGFVVEADQPFEPVNGYAANFCVWSQVGASPYYHALPDFEVKHDGTVIVNNGAIQTPSISGLADTDASVTLGGQATLTNGDGSEYDVTNPASICTKKYADNKIVVCTSAEYAGISPKLSGTLYCLTD